MRLTAGQIYFFDLETGGLRPYKSPIVSGAFSNMANLAKTREVYMHPAMADEFGNVKKIDISEFVNRMSLWSKKKLASSWNPWFRSPKVMPNEFFHNLTTEVIDTARRKPTLLMAHNARFDLSFMSRYMQPEDIVDMVKAVPFKYRSDAMLMALNKMGNINREQTVISAWPQKVWSAISAVNRSDNPAYRISTMTNAYGVYRDTLKRFLGGKSGLMMMDTMTVGKMTFAMAQKLGYMAPTADFSTGHKLDIFRMYNNLQQGTAHIGAEDIKTTSEYFKRFSNLSEKLWHEMRTGQSRLSQQDKDMLRFYSNLQMEMGTLNIRKHIAQLKTELDETGKFPLAWDIENKKQIYSASMKDLLNPENAVYQRYHRQAATYGESFENIVKEVFNSKNPQSYIDQADNNLETIFSRASYATMRGKFPRITIPSDTERSIVKTTESFANKELSTLSSHKKIALLIAAMGVGAYILHPDIKESYTYDPTNSLEELHGRGKTSIHGMHERGIISEIRKKMTDFGSGYRGPNPWLHPSYNTAQDVPRYQLMRASAASHDYEDVLNYMLGNKESSEYAEASAGAGTALHEYLERKFLLTGRATDVEELVYDPANKITGHIDYLNANRGIIGDIKTLNSGRFYTMLRNRKPYPSHIAQVNFYMGVKGYEHGQIYYINRDEPDRYRTFGFNYDPKLFYQTIEKVQKARQQVEQLIASGAVSKSILPKAASLETLQEYQVENPSPTKETVTAQDLDKYQQAFQEEMEYLRTVKRGMPKKDTAAIQRIEDANKKRREQIDWRTAGIGLQMYKDAHQSRIFR